jgi:dTDP-glucose 4,6-dehydratase
MNRGALERDLDQVLEATEPLWADLAGERLFITGGTGFFGSWLLETFTWACDRLGIEAEAHVLTRDPAAFRQKAPHLADHPSVRFVEGDVATFRFPAGRYRHVIHAATPASAQLNAQAPGEMLSVILAGTRRVLDFARAAGTERFLLTSSGAVYGPQAPDLVGIPDAAPTGPDPTDPRAAYGEGKRVAELMAVLAGGETGMAVTIARCFAFLGPYLPLDSHFAAGNFLRDALLGRPIVIKGDGKALRSYLYAADLATWLWTILFRGEAGRAYNVGSETAVSIAELARATAEAVTPGVEVQILGGTSVATASDRYVPRTERARSELGLLQTVSLDEAIRRTIHWHRQRVAAGPLHALRGNAT